MSVGRKPLCSSQWKVWTRSDWSGMKNLMGGDENENDGKYTLFFFLGVRYRDGAWVG